MKTARRRETNNKFDPQIVKYNIQSIDHESTKYKDSTIDEEYKFVDVYKRSSRVSIRGTGQG